MEGKKKKKEKNRKTLWKKVKLLILSNFTFPHNVSHAICILKFLNCHISVVVCSFLEFGMVSKWCIGEWVKSGIRGFIVASQGAKITSLINPPSDRRPWLARTRKDGAYKANERFLKFYSS